MSGTYLPGDTRQRIQDLIKDNNVSNLLTSPYMYGAAFAARRITATEYRISGPYPFCRTRPWISTQGC